MNRILIASLILMIGIGAFFVGRFTVEQPLPPPEIATDTSLAQSIRERDWSKRTQQFSRHMSELNAENLEASLATIESSEVKLTDDELRLLMHAWTRIDPEGALQHALFSPEEDRRHLSGAVLYTWASLDPIGAQRALLGIQNTDLERILQGWLVTGWVETGAIQDVQEYVGNLEAGARRDFITRQVAEALAKDRELDLKLWAERLEPERNANFKNTVLVKATLSLGKTRPLETADWLKSHFGNDYASGAARALARNWVSDDHDATFEWLSSLPPGEERNEAIEFIYSYWFKKRPHKASAWLERITPKPAMDPAVEYIAKHTMIEDTIAAIDWARRISDTGTRERTLVKIGQSWYRQDPVATKRWLSVSSLPRAARKAILGP